MATINFETRKERLLEEMKKKAQMLSEELIEMAGGDHICVLHHGLTDKQLQDRARCIKNDASSFFERQTVLASVKALITDGYSAEQIADLVLSDFCGRRDDLELFTADGSFVGRGFSFERQEFFDSDITRIVLEFKGYREYRNKITGLPFDIVNVYPVDPEL